MEALLFIFYLRKVARRTTVCLAFPYGTITYFDGDISSITIPAM